MYALYILSGLLALATSKPLDPASGQADLVLSLNKQLLVSLEAEGESPNPSLLLALRLSPLHNLAQERRHLTTLTTTLHDHIQSSLSGGQPVAGRLALYVLALRASCYDLNTLTFTLGQKSSTLLTHLKIQMDLEKDNIALSGRPLTSYYQYSLGVLALCVSGVRVNTHVSNKLLKAVEHGLISESTTDSVAMAAMALQCVKEAGSLEAGPLEKALGSAKDKLVASRRADGHLGNEFSTGLAVQALLAMGAPAEEYAASMEALRSEVKKGTYVNPMAVSQTLPALQHTSYLQVKNKQCRNDDDSLVVQPSDRLVLPAQTQAQPSVDLKVKVLMSSGAAAVFPVEVPSGSSLLDALELLQKKNSGFTFEKESSLWGPFLSEVNGERARQSDRRYWRISTGGAALSHGITDYKIEMDQQISITNTVF